MKLSKFNPAEMFNDVGRFSYIRLTEAALACASWCAADTKRGCLLQVGAGLTLTTIAGVAHAEGFADMFTQGATQAASMKTSFLQGVGAAGVACASYGGYNWWRKGKEGDNSHIKGGQIVGPIMGGAVMAGGSYVLVKGAETIGIPGVTG